MPSMQSNMASNLDQPPQLKGVHVALVAGQRDCRKKCYIMHIFGCYVSVGLWGLSAMSPMHVHTCL